MDFYTWYHLCSVKFARNPINICLFWSLLRHLIFHFEIFYCESQLYLRWFCFFSFFLFKPFNSLFPQSVPFLPNLIMVRHIFIELRNCREIINIFFCLAAGRSERLSLDLRIARRGREHASKLLIHMVQKLLHGWMVDTLWVSLGMLSPHNWAECYFIKRRFCITCF